MTANLPTAISEGTLKIGDHVLRVYQLSDGRRVIDREDVVRFFLGASIEEIADVAALSVDDLTPKQGGE